MYINIFLYYCLDLYLLILQHRKWNDAKAVKYVNIPDTGYKFLLFIQMDMLNLRKEHSTEYVSEISLCRIHRKRHF